MIKNALTKVLVLLGLLSSSICFAMETDNSLGPTILVVIDMQPESFCAAQDTKLIEALSKRISDAIEKKQRIFFVEYSNNDYRIPCVAIKFINKPTDSTLTDICLHASYEYVIIKKYRDDGSANIMNKLVELGIQKPKRIKICGVNTSLCVSSTVLGLTELFPSTEMAVLQDACHDENGESSHKSALKVLASRPKIKIK